jgi:TrmH family RNA methyltransferase
MTVITSPQNPRVKNAVRLREGRFRRRQGRMLIEGASELGRAIRAGIKPIETFVCESLSASEEVQALLRELPAAGGEILHVSPRVFEKLAFGRRGEGLLAVAAVPQTTLESLALGDCPLVAVLEGVEKPGNLGAVLRSADAAGVAALIAADARCDLYNPHVIRASLGTIFSVPARTATSVATLDWLLKNDMQIIAARVDAAEDYTAVDFRRPTAIVLGSEAEGLSAAWNGPRVRPVRLPMRGAADSLNVSVAAAVMFYEALRQREES